MNQMKSILFQQQKNIGQIILNRPSKCNALSHDLLLELQNQLKIIRKKNDVSVIIIKGNGSTFSAGHDLNELLSKKSKDEIQTIFTTCTTVMNILQEMPQPIIASVHGPALAAGCQLVATCDLAIASEKATFATPGVNIGLFCYTPMVPISRLIGQKNALELLLTGQRFSAQKAMQVGLINRVVAVDDLESETWNLAEHLNRLSKKVLQEGKQAFYHQINMDLENAYQFAVDQISSHCLSEEAQEGMTALIEKRKPIWKK